MLHSRENFSFFQSPSDWEETWKRDGGGGGKEKSRLVPVVRSRLLVSDTSASSLFCFFPVPPVVRYPSRRGENHVTSSFILFQIGYSTLVELFPAGRVDCTAVWPQLFLASPFIHPHFPFPWWSTYTDPNTQALFGIGIFFFTFSTTLSCCSSV